MIIDLILLLFVTFVSVINAILSSFASVFVRFGITSTFAEAIRYFLVPIWYWQGFIDVPATLDFIGHIIGALTIFFIFNAIAWGTSLVRGSSGN